MLLPDLTALQQAAKQVYQHLSPSPQLSWPLLNERCDAEIWVKHENHNPTGAFKVRGGLVYMQRLRQAQPELQAVVTATRGNHGQSVAFAAARHGFDVTIVVPEGNNPDKNAAMRALGAELVVHGADFDDAVAHAAELAERENLHRMPSFHMDLVEGVASYALELLQAQPDLERIYVPIGLGSGVCGTICARNALGLNTEIVGVVSDGADCYYQSLVAGHCVPTESAATLADGLAVRTPSPEALALMRANVDHIVRVSDDQVLQAIDILFTDTHNVAEGAGAAALAAAMQEAGQNQGRKIAVVLSGGNIDKPLFCRALAGSQRQ